MKTTKVAKRRWACVDHGPLTYDNKHDEYFCESCDEWLGKRCDDQHCQFCATRPPKPSEVNYAIW